MSKNEGNNDLLGRQAHSFAIVHLSDLHIYNDATIPSDIVENVIRDTRSHVRGKDAVILVLSGDIAFSGLDEQYEIAKDFITHISEEIRKEMNGTLHICMAPGNHDCQFTKDPLRDLARKEVIQNHASASERDLVEACLRPQKAYREFCGTLEYPAPDFDDGLWKEQFIDIDGQVVGVFSVNAAWLSQKKESANEMYFPVGMYGARLPASHSDLNFICIHHPPNWFSQETYQSFRELFRINSCVVLSGHEHYGVASQIETEQGRYLHFEANALVPEDDGEAGFSIYEVDLEQWEVTVQRYKFSGQSSPEVEVRELPPPPPKANKHGQLTAAFERQLDDLGGVFTTQEGVRIRLQDVFVYPHLEYQNATGDDEKYCRANEIFTVDGKQQYTLICGDDTAGKSSLCFKAFRHFHNSGRFPVFIKAANIKRAATTEIRKVIDKALEEQYESGAHIFSEGKSDLILIIDDIDEIAGKKGVLGSLLQFGRDNFGSLLVTSDTEFNFAELIDEEVQRVIGDFENYRIRPFGHELRFELVKRWCAQGTSALRSDFEEKVHGVESTLNAVIGRNLVPSHPFYLLILLQSMEIGAPASLQSSSLAYYYQYLITKGLNQAGLKADRHDEVMNYLANLAWFFHAQKTSSISHHEFQSFNAEFCKNFHNVNYSERLLLLTKSRILLEHSDVLVFTYPYIYHFFLGKFLARNLGDPEVDGAVSEMCRGLESRDSSHTLMFLCHHDSSRAVIEKIREVLNSSFSDHAPMKYESDLESIDALVGTSSSLAIEKLDVSKSQIEYRKGLDEKESETQEDEQDSKDAPQEVLGLLTEVRNLMRSLEILGQILKNYYGSLPREYKEELLRDVFDGPLRLFGALLDNMGNDPDALVAEIERALESSRPDLDAAEKKRIAQKAAYEILGMIGYGIVLKPARSVSTIDLDDDIAGVVQGRDTVAFRLIRAASLLTRPNLRKLGEIKSLADELRDSRCFAFEILQSLGAMHMHLFSLPESERQQLCSALDISVVGARKRDFISRPIKHLPRS